MSDDNPSIMSHVSVGVSDYDRAKAFYDRVLGVLGAKRLMEHGRVTCAYGKQYPEFWIGLPHDGAPPSSGNGAHFGFLADSTAQVDAFHAQALAAGGTDDGAPGYRPLYGPQYYGAFVRDPDGNKIEASFWDESRGG